MPQVRQGHWQIRTEEAERRDRRLAVLLRDHDHEFQGNALISKGVRGFTSDSIVGRFRSIFAAAEYLVPFVAKIDRDEYSRRFREITKPL